jgi:hypothetical protein
MFIAIATLVGLMGGDSVMSDIAKRFPFDPYPKGWFQVAYSREVEQDIPIWENKIYRDRPQLARGEGAITEFRAWARQSYEEAFA